MWLLDIVQSFPSAPRLCILEALHSRLLHPCIILIVSTHRGMASRKSASLFVLGNKVLHPTLFTEFPFTHFLYMLIIFCSQT